MTSDTEATAKQVIGALYEVMPFGKSLAAREPDVARVTDDSKVNDHHAIIPTREVAGADLGSLPASEHDILTLIACRMLAATAARHI